MTQTTSSIMNSWSLIAFAKQFGAEMRVGEFTNSQSGEIFRSCIFLKEGEKTFVRFSQNLGELSPREIVNRKDDLQVVLLDTGKYSLCSKGENQWELVDLGL